jgi:hypothetical protein
MVKIVVRDDSPDLDPESFAARPRTLYRLGTRYGRLEEAADYTRGVQGLVVVNEPDIWIVNLLEDTGQHLKDEGDPYHFHAPVIGGPGVPQALLDLELGCEVQYLLSHGTAPPRDGVFDGTAVTEYEIAVDHFRVVLFVSREAGTPVALRLFNGRRLDYEMRYLEYMIGLEPRMSLFERPLGVEFPDPE